MGKIVGLIASAALMAVLVPMAGQAEHCDSQIVIFSSNSAGTPAINSNAGTCPVADHAYDSRLINPLSDQVTVRFIQDGACTLGDTMDGTLDGLGVENMPLLFECIETQTGATVFDTPGQIAIDETASGCITATLGEESNSFHTIDSGGCFE